MRDLGKRNVLGVLVDAVDLEAATKRIVQCATESRPLATTALAVHGLVSAARDSDLRARVNHLDLVTPDGQPVRWALNLLHRAQLPERVAGPRLMLDVCIAAAANDLPVFFYGSRGDVLDRLIERFTAQISGLTVAGAEPSLFRRTSEAEKNAIAEQIRASGARITFVGLGCPRQEVFAYEYRDALEMPVIAVGAAFDFHAGLLNRPPAAIQRLGLEWAFRLIQEPRRLWRRYATTNPRFLALVMAQWTKMWRPDPADVPLPNDELRYG